MVSRFFRSQLTSPQRNPVALDLAVLSIVALSVLFLRLGNSRFWDQDEGYYASVALEMYRRGDWIVPTFNEQLFAHKPPMMYWGMLLGFHALGVSEFAARLPSAIFGLGCSLLTYQLGRRWFDRRTGLFAGLATTSCLMFSVVARSATADVYLTFFVLLAFCAWSRDALAGSSTEAGGCVGLTIPWRTWVAAYAAMGCAVLSKGPIGLAFPITILAAVHALDPILCTAQRSPGSTWMERAAQSLRVLHPIAVLKVLWSMRPCTGIAVVALVAGPWFVAMHFKTGGAFLGEFLGVHHLNRFSQAMDNHGGPVYYYVIACAVGLYPWSAFAIPTALEWFRPEQRDASRRAWLLVTVWIAVYLVVFSIASTKLPNYVIPAYPAIAIVIGLYIARWTGPTEPWAWRWQAVGWCLLVVVGLMVMVIPLVATTSVEGRSWLDRFRLDESSARTIRWASVLGIPLIVGGLLGFGLRLQNRNRALAPCFAGMAAAMMVLFWQVLVPMADRQQTPQDIATQLSQARRDASGAVSIAVVEYFRPSMVFYAGNPIDFFSDVPSLAAKLEQGSTPIIVLKESSLEPLQSHLPDGYRITQTHAEFPRRGKVLVLEPTLRR